MMNNRQWAALAPQTAIDAQRHEYMRVRGSIDVQSTDRKNKKRTQKRSAEQAHGKCIALAIARLHSTDIGGAHKVSERKPI